MSKLFKATLYVAVVNLIGLALNFLLNLVLAAEFGIDRELDLYLTATAVPNYLVTILAGSLSVTFIPAFVDQTDNTIKGKLLGSILIIGFVAGFVLTGTIFCFSDWIIRIQTPGFTPEMVLRSAYLLRCFVIMILFTIINEIIAGFFYSSGQYLLPAINKIISPSIAILLIYLMPNPTALTIILANVAGLLVQNIILIYSFWRRRYRIEFKVKILNPRVISILKLMTPLLVGSIFYKVLPVFDKYFLSTMPPGSISIINYSQKLFLAATQVIGAALSMQILSHMAKLVADKKNEEFKGLLRKMVRILLYFAIPISALCIVFGDQIIELVYQRGKFNGNDTLLVAHNFKIFVLTIPAVAVGTIISQGLYVLKDTWSPFVVGLIEVSIYIIFCFMLMERLGIAALPTAYVIYFYFSVIVLGAILLRRSKFIPLKELVLFVGSCLLLTGAMLLLLHFVSDYIPLKNYWFILGAVVSFIFYLVMSYLFKLNEAHFIYSQILLEKSKISLFSRKK